MNKKRCLLYGIVAVAGLAVAILGGSILREIFNRSICAVFIGGGSSVFGVGIAGIVGMFVEKKYPERKREKEINEQDERNQMLRHYAKAKSSDVVQWFILGTAYATIAMGLSMWVTLMLVGVYFLKHVLDVYYMSKLEKEF